MSTEQALALHAQSEEIHSAEVVEAAIDRLAAALNAHLAGRHPVLLCVLNGGIYLVGQLLPRLRITLELDSAHASRYRGHTEGGELTWTTYPRLAMQGRHVVLIDDVFDEGHTLAAMVRYCADQGAARVWTAVLADKRHQRKVAGLTMDFVGLEVPDRYVYGAGMDIEEHFRQLPAIYARPVE